MKTTLKLVFLAILMLPAIARAQSTNRITAQITVTNGTMNAFAFTLNGDTRTWTNSVSSAATQILTNSTVAGAASNFYYHVVARPFTTVNVLSYTNGSNVINLRGALAQAMSVTILSNWATVSYSTQVFSSGMIDVRVPVDSEVVAVRTNVASQLVYGAKYSTNAHPETENALSNFVSRGASQTLGNKTITNSGLRNIWASNMVATNFSSPGAGAGSQVIGSGATAAGDGAVVYGVSATGAGENSVTVGTSAAAAGENAVAVGDNTVARELGATALGVAAKATNVASTALGSFAEARNASSTAIGASAVTTADNQVRLGTVTETVSIPGTLTNTGTADFLGAVRFWAALTIDGAAQINGATTISNALRVDRTLTASNAQFTAGLLTTNSTLNGTNVINGRVDFTPRANTTLANGYNSGVVLGTNAWLQLSGPSAAYTNVGFAAAVSGTWHLVSLDNPVSSIGVLDNSGLEATAANRIRTGTGGTLVLTNNPAWLELIYDAGVARWRVIRASN